MRQFSVDIGGMSDTTIPPFSDKIQTFIMISLYLFIVTTFL